MAMLDWGALTPSRVADWINFDRDDPDWHYAEGSASMQNRQAEGVAGIWNILSSQNVALLADEVGMGKTIQALGVMSLLWKANPDARVLVMAPNRDICTHWAREYYSFLRDHYKEIDHLVRNAADGGPVHEPHYCWRLRDLVQSVKTGSGHFYLTTIYSLSGLVPSEEKEKGDIVKKAEREAADIHRELKDALGGDGFDLIIVDEAHYFRNAKGDSQRARAGRRFFGDSESRLGQKVLLMTATPSHSSLQDVPAILGFFKDLPEEGPEASPGKLLQLHALRRLRLMQGATSYHNKYNYRHEYALPSSFDDNPNAELFFALYQKKLVQQKDKKGNGRRYLYGYLEGFESVGNTGQEGVSDSLWQNAESVKSDDFTTSDDSDILARLTELYYRHFSCYPEHPKYNALVKSCVPGALFDSPADLHEFKHLVFVRRIPSVREITQRINAEYDRILASMIFEAWGVSNPERMVIEWVKAGWSRAFFNSFIQDQGASAQDAGVDGSPQTDEDYPDQESDEKLGSRVADLFVVKKVGNQRSTDASNVSLRFRKPESIFSLFLEPASDYRDGKYHFCYRKQSGDKLRDDYGAAALDSRLSLHDSYTRKSELAGRDANAKHLFSAPLDTAWGMMLRLLSGEQRGQIDAWLKRDPGIVENFGNYVKAGFLFASPVMVELYCWFTEFNRSESGGDAQERYRRFTRWVTPKLSASLMYRYFVAALDTFESICGKICDHGLADWQHDWRVLTSLQNPAWYASGESGKRQRLILGFNSPFYPNVLVATSVFQEGVNLHLQCRKVHHYGIAWTPGDNEQRVGRVDRLFGMVNHQLRTKGQAELAIHYPYLERSFDQEQLASFIRLKHSVEARMDACQQADFNDEIELQQSSSSWEQFLRTPDGEVRQIDPFPARFDPSLLPDYPYQPVSYPHSNDLKALLQRLIDDAARSCPDGFETSSETDLHPGIISLIETDIVDHASYTKLPIVAELHFLSEFSALVSGTAYTLTFRAPLASQSALGAGGVDRLDKWLQMFERLDRMPLVRMALDVEREKGNFFLYLRADLPFFPDAEGMQQLSEYEVRSALVQLKCAATILQPFLYEISDFMPDGNVHKVEARKAFGRPMKEGALVDSVTGPVTIFSQHVHNDSVQVFADAWFSSPLNQSFFVTLLRLNHYLPMMGFRSVSEGTEMRIAFPADDIQPEEKKLITRWFGFVENRLSNRLIIDVFHE